MFSRAAVDRQVTLLTFLALLARGATSGPLASATDLPRNTPVIYTAIVNVTYRDPATGEQRYEYNDGWFSSENRIGPSWGWLQVARSANNRTDGCDPIVNRADGWWVALVERGRCRFHQKIENAAVFNNASAVIIYNNEHDAQVLNMQHGVEDVVAIFLRRNDGLRLLKLMENSTRVFVTITPGSTYFPSMDAPSRTSVIFLFISFIVLAVVSLLWLIFYYVQRFRVHGSLGVERARKNKMAVSQKQLNRAAKLVVSKMEQKVLKPDDPELLSEELQICAVCVEEYKANDKIRILPCKHTFHKKCVDQWLHDKRRCPICQLDILKTAGIQIPDEYQTLNSSNNPAAAPGNNNNDSIEDDNYGAVNSPATSGNHSPLDDTILVSVVPGCSAHLYLTYVEDRSGEAGAVTPGDGQRPRGHMADNVSDTTYHSNESLLDTFDGKDVIAISLDEEGIVGPEFKSRLSSDSLSLPSGMTASSSSSSSSSTFDIREKGKGRPDDKSNNNNVSTTSINSRLTAVASPAIDDDDNNNNNSNNNGDDDDDDDSPSSSFSPSRYYDCHGEAPVHKSQMV